LRVNDADASVLKLKIDGVPLAIKPKIDDREIVFPLTRDKDTQASWMKILGSAFDKRKTVTIALEVNDNPVKYRPQPASDESPQAKVDLLPADPASFAIVAKGGKIPDVNLKDTLRIRIDGDTPIDESKVQVRIDGDLLNVTPPRRPSDRELAFPLVRNDKNRPLWSRLLGSPFSEERREVPVSVEVGGKALKYGQLDKDSESPQPRINVVAYNGVLMIAGIIGVVVVIAVSWWFAANTTLIKDSLIPQMRRSDRTFSLGRLQMLVWFCLIFSSFVFIFTVTFDLNSITPESFILMGISASTALAAVAIERSKTDPDPAKDPIQNARNSMEACGIKTCEQADALFEANGKDPRSKASTIIPGARTPTEPDPTVGQLWAEYEKLIARFRSSGLLKDLVTDVNGPTIHRWQILIWTLVLGAIYIARSMRTSKHRRSARTCLR